jgi:hypothetical protein
MMEDSVYARNVKARDSSVDIATLYGLDGLELEPSTDDVQSTSEYKEIQPEGENFSLVHTGCGTHTASYTMGTGSLSRE